MTRPWLAALLFLLPGAAAASELAEAVSNKEPWKALELGSEQRPPYYLGLTPLQLSRGEAPVERALLPAFAKELGERQARQVMAALDVDNAELEFWPATDDEGAFTFVFARRRLAGGAWVWLDGLEIPDTPWPAPILPAVYRGWKAKDRKKLFTDALAMPGLYDAPAFANCLWTDNEGAIAAGWPPPSRRAVFAEEARPEGRKMLCRAVPQPAVLNGQHRTFVLKVGAVDAQWPEELAFEPPAPEPPAPALPGFLPWPADFAAEYQADVLALSGETELVLPDSGRRARLTRKSSAQEDHQLEIVVDWLAARYSELGLATTRQAFLWRGIPQSNLIAVIPGSAPADQNRPILLVDHIDTAFAEDLFRKGKGRVSVPGADDDASGTAALLQAARLLPKARKGGFTHDIWLVHLTGEEYPAAGIGGRELISRLLREGRELGGVLVLDMIGYRDPGDSVFQLNPGADERSRFMASAALAASKALGSDFTATVRTRWDPFSYLYNTDGLAFAEAGYPVLLLNEHVNARHNLMRTHYHESTDLSKHMDFALAEHVARTAIETAAFLASGT